MKDANANEQNEQSQPLDALYWRDEILQVMYWYKGEGFGDKVAAQDLTTFLLVDESFLYTQLENLVEEGYLKRESETAHPRYSFTPFGAREGARRFADEFADLVNQGHGECAPDCPYCKDQPRDSCIHCSTSASSV